MITLQRKLQLEWSERHFVFTGTRSPPTAPLTTDLRRPATGTPPRRDASIPPNKRTNGTPSDRTGSSPARRTREGPSGTEYGSSEGFHGRTISGYRKNLSNQGSLKNPIQVSQRTLKKGYLRHHFWFQKEPYKPGFFKELFKEPIMVHRTKELFFRVMP
ncbi:hypothetical protein EYF80_042243 [Liparis tanakae]|uniref:Uncharacterized protein n=1 Tax=Liparis tanakae TaxID=230148 RepID=A0A4Z2G2Q4_9TELE|nr:hypothetical protein EYF80_042243 [Liparis tanakae]